MFLVIAGLLVLGLLGGIGAYAVLGRRSAVVSQSGPTSAPAPSQVSQPITVDTPFIPVATETPTPAVGIAPLRSVESHWEAIRNHRFDEAYSFLGPRLATGQASWVSSHERDGITDILYNFNVRDVNGDTATVDIVKLQTKAQSARSPANPEGCLSWTGNYVLVREGERWVISQANVASTPC